MNFSIRLKELKDETGYSNVKIAESVGVGRSTITGWLKQEYEPNSETLVKLADLFNVNEPWLMGFDVPKYKENQQSKSTESDSPYYTLTEKEKLDIGMEVDKLLDGLYSTAEVNFYGEPMTDEGKDKLRVAIQMAMELNKEKAKKKFTPKKYRNE